MHATLHLLEHSDFPKVMRAKLETIQVNLGYRCNQQCLHCHVNANPNRKENMTKDTAVQIVSYLKSANINSIDLTGGAPELNPNFRYIVSEASALGVHIMDRCNLTILLEPGQEDLAEFLAQHKVEVIASLPCYSESNVDNQRGEGVFKKSIQGLKKLNALGYGIQGSGLALNLVYNPLGPTLPPAQNELEQSYKKQLFENFGINFNQLYTLTNMPIKRFGSTLISNGQFDDYMNLLRGSHRQENVPGVMCRSLISVDWQGYLYDCDFNQMLDLPLQINGKRNNHISDLLQSDLQGNTVAVADHCYGCTAGQGSSCGGALD